MADSFTRASLLRATHAIHLAPLVGAACRDTCRRWPLDAITSITWLRQQPQTSSGDLSAPGAIGEPQRGADQYNCTNALDKIVEDGANQAEYDDANRETNAAPYLETVRTGTGDTQAH